jgi:hypothetical protein
MAGVTEAQMIEHIEKVLPTLKRWKNAWIGITRNTRHRQDNCDQFGTN